MEEEQIVHEIRAGAHRIHLKRRTRLNGTASPRIAYIYLSKVSLLLFIFLRGHQAHIPKLSASPDSEIGAGIVSVELRVIPRQFRVRWR